jgi:hypothetical protein
MSSHIQYLTPLLPLVPKLVMQGLASEMPKILEQKLESKKIEAEIEVLKEEHQAGYFFEKYKVLREERQAKKEKSPTYWLKKKISPDVEMSDSSEEDAM